MSATRGSRATAIGTEIEVLMDVRGELTATFKRSDWAMSNCSNQSRRNCHRNDANYVEKARLDLKTSASLPPSAPVSSKTNESCWFSDKLERRKKSWQRKRFSGVKNLRSAPLNTYCSFSRWFNQNWQAHSSPSDSLIGFALAIVSFYDMPCQVFNTS